jgi:hypothetical protein
MKTLVATFLLCLAVAGCTTDSRQASVIVSARDFAKASPKCKAVLDEYPGILANGQELPSQAPIIAVAFDHDELIKGSSRPDGKTRLNVRILVEIDSTSGNMKSIGIKETTY